MIAALLLVFLALGLIVWMGKRSSERRRQELEAIERVAYLQGKAEWDAYFELLYALNPGLREAVEASKGNPLH